MFKYVCVLCLCLQGSWPQSVQPICYYNNAKVCVGPVPVFSGRWATKCTAPSIGSSCLTSFEGLPSSVTACSVSSSSIPWVEVRLVVCVLLPHLCVGIGCGRYVGLCVCCYLICVWESGVGWGRYVGLCVLLPHLCVGIGCGVGEVRLVVCVLLPHLCVGIGCGVGEVRLVVCVLLPHLCVGIGCGVGEGSVLVCATFSSKCFQSGTTGFQKLTPDLPMSM